MRARGFCDDPSSHGCGRPLPPSRVVFRHHCGGLNDYAHAQAGQPLFCATCRFEVKPEHVRRDVEFFTLSQMSAPAGFPE